MINRLFFVLLIKYCFTALLIKVIEDYDKCTVKINGQLWSQIFSNFLSICLPALILILQICNSGLCDPFYVGFCEASPSTKCCFYILSCFADVQRKEGRFIFLRLWIELPVCLMFILIKANCVKFSLFYHVTNVVC